MVLKKNQTIDYNFPKQGYFGGIIVDTKDKNRHIIYLETIQRSPSEFADSVNEALKNLDARKNTNISINNSIIIIPIKRQNKYSLKIKYWDIPSDPFNYSNEKRIRNMRQAVDKYKLYNLLVTPSGINDKKEEEIVAAFCYLKNRPQELDLFMNTSNWPVDIKAKSYAIYTIQKYFMYDLKTGEHYLINKGGGILVE